MIIFIQNEISNVFSSMTTHLLCYVRIRQEREKERQALGVKSGEREKKEFILNFKEIKRLSKLSLV